MAAAVAGGLGRVRGRSRGHAAAAPQPRRPSPLKKNRRADRPKKKIGALIPPSKKSTEHCVFLSFYQVFEELRENRHQIRDLREKLRI